MLARLDRRSVCFPADVPQQSICDDRTHSKVMLRTRSAGSFHTEESVERSGNRLPTGTLESIKRFRSPSFFISGEPRPLRKNGIPWLNIVRSRSCTAADDTSWSESWSGRPDGESIAALLLVTVNILGEGFTRPGGQACAFSMAFKLRGLEPFKFVPQEFRCVLRIQCAAVAC